MNDIDKFKKDFIEDTENLEKWGFVALAIISLVFLFIILFGRT